MCLSIHMQHPSLAGALQKSPNTKDIQLSQMEKLFFSENVTEGRLEASRKHITCTRTRVFQAVSSCGIALSMCTCLATDRSWTNDFAKFMLEKASKGFLAVQGHGHSRLLVRVTMATFQSFDKPKRRHGQICYRVQLRLPKRRDCIS